MRRAGRVLLLTLIFTVTLVIVGPIIARPARSVNRGGCQLVDLQIVCWEGDPPATAGMTR